MYGLTIRWSLTDADAVVSDKLRTYVRDESIARFTGMPGLLWKTWQMVDGGFFAGNYVWATEQARTEFLESFRASPSAVTLMVGHTPDVVQEFDVVGIAVGAEGFPS
ncbi:MAG: hypothetical protein ABIO67_00775 [Mycobacteriales bacterium]